MMSLRDGGCHTFCWLRISAERLATFVGYMPTLCSYQEGVERADDAAGRNGVVHVQAARCKHACAPASVSRNQQTAAGVLGDVVLNEC